jgi:hypothetical protein
MFDFCGQKFQVHKRAHKTCDTVFPIRGRRVERTVHLETRCNGSAHGGCDAGCLIFWKEAWLKPCNEPSGASDVPTGATGAKGSFRISEADVLDRVRRTETNGRASYSCQATCLPYATSDLKWWEMGQYFEDYWSGNVPLTRMFATWFYSFYFHLSQARLGLGPIMRWLYDKINPLFGGTRFPRKTGIIPVGQPTPVANLNLQPGELVRIKPYEEILKTLDTDNKNRGMFWDAEEVPYCGQSYRVLRRVNRIVNEQTGELQVMKTPSVILDTVVCESRYSECRLFCPRGIYPYWREVWLERVEAVPGNQESVESEVVRRG